ncbi:acetoacetate decarboxylase family protein [Phenylobacterium montanum]|uniref:Acetoacetate decarboxylase family protein n=1 Tax=Phenylobacterium montanum TaxID=2823693 RepID=A0A975G273_9CAUL|nr:acetoacetate decarboxylase family protein [Caulobacter sp. S6]QUD88646.1 acetoacetate decarboxylase family protein [Caulobacter sp. S6]
MKGLFYPRTPTGRASIVPPPPWHYSGELLTFEYRTDPAAVAALLPEGMTLADEDPGAVAAIWADWQSCSDDFSEILDPVRGQYKEMFFVVRCKFQGRTYSRCVYIWVDKDFAMLRGQHQGYPKKLGSIHMSRPVTLGKAGPRLEPGGTFGATLSAMDRRLAQACFTLTAPAERPGFVNGLPMVHNRWLPAIETNGTDSLSEVVTMSGYDGQMGRCFQGDFDLELFDSPVEELMDIRPIEKIGAYWHEVGVSWRAGTTLARNNLT